MTSGFLRKYCRQRPTLPYSFPYSTIGGIRLNFRVRNGNGGDPDPMTTGILDCGLWNSDCGFPRAAEFGAWGSAFAASRLRRDKLHMSLARRSAEGAQAARPRRSLSKSVTT